jgi:hypothetical protein
MVKPSIRLVALGFVVAVLGSLTACDNRPTPIPQTLPPPPPPTQLAVSYVSPDAGRAGDFVLISGSGFHPDRTVTFGGVVARVEQFPAATSSLVIVRAPALSAGRVDVVVTNPNGERATLAGGFVHRGRTITGTVFEFSDSGLVGPVPNLRLKVRWGVDGPKGDLPDVVTDADGRYSIPDVPTDMVFLRTAPGSEVRSLCDAWPIIMDARPPLPDLPVVHKSWAGTRPPPGSWLYGALWGVVSERVDGRSQPIEGATVSGLQDPPATTNASGLYISCTPPGAEWSGVTYSLTAEKHGYNQKSRVLGSFDLRYDFELTRVEASSSGR